MLLPVVSQDGTDLKEFSPHSRSLRVLVLQYSSPSTTEGLLRDFLLRMERKLSLFMGGTKGVEDVTGIEKLNKKLGDFNFFGLIPKGRFLNKRMLLNLVELWFGLFSLKDLSL